MLIQEIIAAKRDGKTLSSVQIEEFIAGATKGSVSEGQVAAFAMAIYLNGMARSEIVALTTAMRDSGDVLDWSALGEGVVDKHSTGGIGDNVSIMLAPMVAACGGFVPMISGRGLGHTGGTLDKFESIPGYRTAPENAIFRQTVATIGCAVIGQTANLAPADRRIYAIRDVTATVESIPLITASILSKKLAAGLKGLVLDVKTGSGAFMASPDDARELADSLVSAAKGAGLKSVALITDMDHPLAPAAGNALEMRNAIEFLCGHETSARLAEVVNTLGAQMLVLAGIAEHEEAGLEMMKRVLASGAAAERFAKMVAALGGPTDLLEATDRYLERAPLQIEVIAPPAIADKCAGALSFDSRELGLAVIELGGGRRTPQDGIDHSVGLSDIAERDWDGKRPLCLIHARDREAAGIAEKRILDAVRPGTEHAPVIVERVD